MSDHELYHYGVVGMKWGIRRARRKEAKATYRKATDKAFKEYEREIGRIEKPYKRGQNLSAKDMAREEAAERKYRDAANKAKAEYKQNRNSKANDVAIANRLYSKNSEGANARIAQMSTAHAFAQSYLLGSYGALKYNEMRSLGFSKGQSAVVGIISSIGDAMFGSFPSTIEYMDNRAARKK